MRETAHSDSSPGSGLSFLGEAEAELLGLSAEAQRAEWVYETYITPDTAALTTRAEIQLSRAITRLAKEARRQAKERFDPTGQRRLARLLLLGSEVPPEDPALAHEMGRLATELRGHYAAARAQGPGLERPLDLNAIREVFRSSRDPELLTAVWTGWHDTAGAMHEPYARFVALANQGARELGFADTGAMWRSKYDMAPEAFRAEVMRLWSQVKPLYTLLHAFVRRRLREIYGPDRIPAAGAIPAQLLGELWAQDWGELLPDVAPGVRGGPLDLTAALRARQTTPRGMVEYGEGFFRSLGFDALPATLWERSMLTRPADREVLCHASAWQIDYDADVRLKMCLDITADDFYTVHHELGHTYYQLAYRHQPFLFRDGAHDGFHEAIGDAVSLSITPEYFQRVGLASSSKVDPIVRLLGRALERVAFLPSALAIDLWRWGVFDGTYGPESYTSAWWRIREEVGGIAPPALRPADSFDPGAKMHVSCNVPYIRYFLAHILEFQFHRAFARLARYHGRLDEFSAYGQTEVGERLRAMLAMGASRPWPEALHALTGESTMDASALLEYFAPLEGWLREETAGETLGW